ncbi:MAG: GNAT family N-acetyltransferase [Chloroflexi bacterium]|nr:GNAT family N-acetyltransferase [Chloroflexota bacterium]
MTEGVTLRELDSTRDFEDLEELQRQIWPGSDLIVAPMHVLTTVAHNGGLVMGAFDGERMVGFSFGFLGTDARDARDARRPALARLKFCSHQVGVLPEYRDQHVGRMLKLAQREWAMQQGIRLITWTYDPLESRNANLNIARLGCVSQIYKCNVYGDMQDGLNAGLPSDRFQVDWWVTSNRVKQRINRPRPPLGLGHWLQAGATLVNPLTRDSRDLPLPPDAPAWPRGALCAVMIPANFQRVKKADPALALRWRLHLREVCERLFDDGYLVTDFFFEAGSGPDGQSTYLLTRGDADL